MRSALAVQCNMCRYHWEMNLNITFRITNHSRSANTKLVASTARDKSTRLFFSIFHCRWGDRSSGG